MPEVVEPVAVDQSAVDLAAARAAQWQRVAFELRLNKVAGATVAATPLSQEDKMRLDSDAAYFIDRFVQIEEPQAQGDMPSIIPFNLWPRQREVLGQFLVNRLIVILKARQLGLTWLACAYALWMALHKPGQVILLFSKSGREALELVRRISGMYKRLPEWLKAQHPLVADLTKEMKFANGSRVISLASTTSGGRSYTASLVIMDEAAFMMKPGELYHALKPTIDGGGQMIILSTFNKMGDFFDKHWENATKKINRFVSIFLDVFARPTRTKEWYAQVLAEGVSLAHTKKEYPETVEDARVYLGAERFLPSMTFWDECKGELPTQRRRIVLAADGAYAAGGDSFGLVGVSPHPTERGKLVVRLVHKWQAKKDDEPLDFDDIEKEINAIVKRFKVVHIAYDPWGLHHMMGNLNKLNKALQHAELTQEFPQGRRNIADRALLDRIKQGRILHNGDADLRAHIDNADKLIDKEGKKVRIIKRSETDRIDLAVALSMACYRAQELFNEVPSGGGIAMGEAESNWTNPK